MQKSHIPSVLFALLAGFSVAVSAAQPTESAVPQTIIPTQVQASGSPATEAAAAMVNLNTADAVTLERELLGIGEVKAQAIVEYRTANGAFASVDDLLEVKGIGAATLEKNRDKLSIN